MYGKFKEQLQQELDSIESAGLYKKERTILTAQGADVKVKGGLEVVNFCANNYLGLCDSQEVMDAAKKTIDEYGYGMSSVRFICGTQTVHKELEAKLADFHGMEDAILFPSGIIKRNDFLI